ncbi:hypothetical protein EIKCOROL_01935 [Eikenella corrodens ATCC 23834]|uniref:Uncharacterized protein n=1 Tax=Eikenella corrodens ATCC 23834 TaxID=546274 RepID=C0DX32_EIKCO|nr:hypothetical protein EIKCOROL_01935 [Eikenella corrodens ATCC 23834]OWP27424.1 hypothetical protein CA838_03895 [Eikenella corrodens]
MKYINILTFNIWYIIIMLSDKPTTGKAPPKRGFTGRKKMKPTLQILLLVVLMLVSSNAY